MIRKDKGAGKICPFLDQECQRQRCMLYNEKFERCGVDLLAYNAWVLSAALKQSSQLQNLK
jgi:hypothetical protein